MGTRRLDEAVERATTFRLLREIEISEARRVLARIRQPTPDGSVPLGLARVAYEQRVQQLVQHARKWNRQLLIAERDVREALMRRPRRQWSFNPPRFMRASLYGLGVSVGPPHPGVRDAGAK